MEPDDRGRWGLPELVYRGDALEDLHGGTGTPWVRDAAGRGLYPDCDCHRPEVITAERAAAAEQARREQAERDLAAHRHVPYRPAEPAVPKPADPAPGEPLVAGPPPVAPAAGLRLLVAELRRMIGDGEP